MSSCSLMAFCRLAVFCDGSVPYCPLEIQNILIPILNTIIPCLGIYVEHILKLHISVSLYICCGK